MSSAVKEKGKIDRTIRRPERLQHEIAVQRITEIRLVRPKEYQPVAAFAYLEKARILHRAREMNGQSKSHSDDGRKSQTKICVPISLVIHY